MTAQAHDQVIYQKRQYSLAGARGKGLFDPSEHGLKPAAVCSGCWRGFICTYAVVDRQLELSELQWLTGSKSQKYRPAPLFGIDPMVDDGFADYRYPCLTTLIPFTGGLLLCADFIEELYVHMGFHPAWKYREIHELIFREGTLQKTTDCSQVFEGFRKTFNSDLQPDLCAPPKEVGDWIEKTFSLDYSSPLD